MNRVSKLGFVLLILFLVSCNKAAETNESSEKENSVSNVTLSDRLDELKSGQLVNLEDLPGNTKTENLLYLMDVPVAMQAATLSSFDVRIKSLQDNGDKKGANDARIRREIMLQAMSDVTPEFIQKAAIVYDEVFTAEEIDVLTEMYQRPELQKLTKSQLKIRQLMIPVGEEWSKSLNRQYAIISKNTDDE